MKTKTLFLGTTSLFLNSMEILRLHFASLLKPYGIDDLTCAIFLSKGIQSPDKNDGKPCFILKKKMVDKFGEFEREASIAIINEKKCCIKFQFTHQFHGRYEFVCNIKKLEQEKFLEKLANFFLDVKTDYYYQPNRERFILNLKK